MDDLPSALDRRLDGSPVRDERGKVARDMKAVMDGEGDIAYTADVGMEEYLNREGPFEGYDPAIDELAHSFYAYPMESFLVTTEDNAEQFASYGIRAAPDIPVHPGLARFLQERDAWEDDWLIAE